MTNFSTTRSKMSFAVRRAKHCATAEWTTNHKVTSATAQNLKRLVRFLAQRESVPIPCST